MPSKILVLLFCTSITTACVTESKRELVTESVVTKNTTYNGVRSNLVVGNFENRSGSDAGLFGDNSSKLGSQAKTILLTHLQQTQRFIVLERTNMQMNAEEANDFCRGLAWPCLHMGLGFPCPAGSTGPC